jgi:hypothetical protein
MAKGGGFCRWPNAFFAEQGLSSLVAVHASACQSSLSGEHCQGSPKLHRNLPLNVAIAATIDDCIGFVLRLTC